MHIRNRRRDLRQPLECPVKIRCSATGRYLAGHMRDISAGGALVAVDQPSRLVPGLPVSIAIAQGAQANILRAEDMMPAVVVRSMTVTDQQYIALRFDRATERAVAQAA